MNFCMKCGNKLKPGSQFCHYCGAKVIEPKKKAEAPKKEAPAPKKEVAKVPAPKREAPAPKRERCYLIQKSTQEKIQIKLNDNSFRIGRGSNDDVDCIIDNPYVGSYHAKIVCEKGEYFLFDMDSLNGTYVDGKRVTGANPAGPLISGQVIKLANEEFEFGKE